MIANLSENLIEIVVAGQCKHYFKLISKKIILLVSLTDYLPPTTEAWIFGGTR